MSWSQVLNDVTSRLSAASQNLQTFDPVHYSYSFGSSLSNPPACGQTNPDTQSSSMSVRVQLDQQNAPFYTNLDFVTGRVILSLVVDTTISAINVKLEGESRTRLSGLKFQNDPRNRQKIELEIHKLLYKVQTVFPGPSFAQDGGSAQYTLPAGQYTYPFSLKIPFNNDCINNSNIFQDLRLGPLLGPDITNARHVKQTLPPAMAGFPGEAEIKYFVKATVVRPKFYQENMRSVVDIKYQPIEPPRPPNRHEETYARRQHQFQASNSTPKTSKSSLFKKTTEPKPDEQPLAVKVDARLPSPAIVSCHKPLPLKILVEKTNNSSASIYLSLLQIELIGFTNVRAHDLTRTETGSWVIMSQANMKLQLDNPTDKTSRSFQVPPRFWENIPLPNTVAPSFNTCNISRTYELELRIGLSHGMADGIRPELIVLPLRIPVQVYSGISPPPQLLDRISTQQHQTSTPTSTSNLIPPRPNNPNYQHSPVTPTQDLQPPQAGSYMSPPADDPDDLPPSYEDAMAEDIGPVDGPRRDFATSTSASTSSPTTAEPRYNSDVKNTSGLNRHPSERLFSQNAPSPPAVGDTTSRRQIVDVDIDTQQTSGTARDMTDVFTDLNINDNDTVPQQRPPPLPARKSTVDSVSNYK